MNKKILKRLRMSTDRITQIVTWLEEIKADESFTTNSDLQNLSADDIELIDENISKLIHISESIQENFRIA